MKSKRFDLSKFNFLKAALMAALVTIAMYFAPFITGTAKDIFDITQADIISALRDGLKVFVAYLFTTFVTNNEGKFFKKDVIK